jgi:hypothetical protein
MTTKLLVALLLGFGLVALVRVIAELIIREPLSISIAVIISILLFVVQL